MRIKATYTEIISEILIPPNRVVALQRHTIPMMCPAFHQIGVVAQIWIMGGVCRKHPPPAYRWIDRFSVTSLFSPRRAIQIGLACVCGQAGDICIQTVRDTPVHIEEAPWESHKAERSNAVVLRRTRGLNVKIEYLVAGDYGETIAIAARVRLIGPAGGWCQSRKLCSITP